MDAIARFVTRRAGWILLAVVALTAWAAAQLVDPRSGTLRLLIDPSIDRLLPEDDQSRAFYDYVRRLFGSDETLVAVLVDDDVFSAENLRRVARMTQQIERVDGVHHVTSLTTALDIRSVGGELVIEPFLDPRRIPDSPAELARLRREALANPLLAGNLVSTDVRATALLAYLRDMPERELVASGIDRAVARIGERERGDAQFWLTGSLYAKAEHTRLMLQDLARILPLALAVSAAVAMLCFRSLRAALVLVTANVIALIWTLGIIAALGQPLTLVTVIVPPLVLVVGIAYGVHVVSEYFDALLGAQGDAAGGLPVVHAAVRRVGLPVLLTALTTAAGLLSLTLSPLAAIRQFGWLSALGVLASLVCALSFAPAALQLLPGPRRVRDRVREGRFERAAARLGAFDVRRRVPILLAGAAVAAIAVLGTTRIRVSTGFVEPGSDVHRNLQAVNRHLAASGAFYVVLEADYRDAFVEPVNLRVLRELQEWLEAQPEIGRTTSLVDYLMLINRGFHDGDPEHLAIPDSRALARQLLFFGSNDELEGFVDSRYLTAGILVRSRVDDSATMAGLLARIEEHVANLPPHLTASVTGNSVLVTRTLDEIARGQVVSLAAAFGVILLILSLLFTSLRIGLLALLPNAIPVLVYFGVLGLAGVTLNPTTGLVACLVLGIAVDDTIHFLARFNSAARRLADETRGVSEALRTVGRPVTYTTAALCLGFLVLTLSAFQNQVHFGALAACTLAFAWVTDVTFTPALAARMRIVTLWDALTLDLGADPHLSIPLFAGLSKTQARIAALLTRVTTFPAGHRLFRAGAEGGDEMYVVIDGKLTASLETERGRVVFGTMGRGDVLGEVAFFHGVRTADVDTETDVRLLRITHESLDRLRRRYPRIGAQLYSNLSAILANRVATTTDSLR